MATLLELKTEVEAIHNASLRLVFFGAKEAHLLATELAEANVAVIVGPARAQPMDWDSRRVLAGAPLTAETVLSTLKKAGVVASFSFPLPRCCLLTAQSLVPPCSFSLIGRTLPLAFPASNRRSDRLSAQCAGR